MTRIVDHNNHLNFFRLLFALQVVYMHTSHWLNFPKGGELLFDFFTLFPGVLLGFEITNSGYAYIVVLSTTFLIVYFSWTYIEKPMLKLKANK